MKNKQMSSSMKTLIIALCFIVGAGLFIGILRKMGHKNPGYYEISANIEKDKIIWDNGFSLTLYLDGKSNNIRRESARAQVVYTEALKEIKPLFDSEKINENKDNIAAAIAGQGQPVKVHPVIFNALSDIENRGCDAMIYLRESAFRSLWRDLLYLNEPSNFDPLVNADTRERLSAVYKAQNEEDSLTLKLDSSNMSASITLSPAYENILTSYEVDAPALDLGLLGDAYMLEQLSQRLIDEGFSKGYISSDSGIILSLPDTADISQSFYGMYEGTGIKAADILLKAGEACCTLYAFPQSADTGGYYALLGLRRHPYIDKEGEPNQEVLSVAAMSEKGDAAGAALTALNLFRLSEKEAKAKMVDYTKTESVALLLSSSPYNIVLSPGLTRVNPTFDNNFIKSASNFHGLEKRAAVCTMP
jgi:hypothetical protein